MKFNIKITDGNLETDGAWVDWQLDDGVSVKMARSTISTIQTELQKLLRRNRKAINQKNEKLQKEVMIKHLSKHVIKDWKGITNDGEPFKFNYENAIALLEYDDDFYNWVLNESANILNFAEEDEEEDDDSTVEERGEELKN